MKRKTVCKIKIVDTVCKNIKNVWANRFREVLYYLLRLRQKLTSVTARARVSLPESGTQLGAQVFSLKADLARGVIEVVTKE